MQRYKEFRKLRKIMRKKIKKSLWQVKTDSYAVTQLHSVIRFCVSPVAVTQLRSFICYLKISP